MPSLGHLLCSKAHDGNSSNRFDSVIASKRHAQPCNDRPSSRRCSIQLCQKTAKRGGRCIAHGGGNKCVVDGCTTSVVSRGLCVAHGGGKRCQTPACTKSAQSGGFCWVHGGGKKCGYLGCPKRAQSGGACIAHGGGKRCRIDGCNKVVQYDGLCVGHGGYRRCVFDGCDSRAMANDYCQQHGGSSVCLLPQCYRRAVRGGMCSEHKAEASLQAVSARGLSTPTQSSDSERDRRAPKDNPATLHSTQAKRQLSYTTFDSSMPGWQSRMVSRQGSSELRSEFHTPTPHSTQRFQIGESSTRSPSPVRKTTLDSNELRRVDAPVAPGFSALLNANDQFPSFSTFTNKVDSTERYTRHEQQQPRFDHHEQKVYPVLPGIQALQNRSKTPCRDKLSSMIWSDVSVTTSKSSSAEVRIVVTGDTDKLKRISQGDNGHDNFDSDADYSAESPTGKFYVQSCYYRNNDGLLPCSTTPSRHGWGRHHS